MNLLQINDPSLVQKTTLSRKLTLGGITKAYPVFRVRLDLLFYNDQNDRIATWITQYKNDINNVSFANLPKEEYNKIIEKFIIDSNPAAIEKTKNNIALVNQREPGVVLSDGRIIDGNRRFTCLRLLHEKNPEINYFETVILDETIETSEKQIKMLELAIQHGEEQRVDYNQVDMAIGAYHDIEETKLLTIEEYASSTNESIADVKKRLEVAKLVIEFLEFMNVPKQYHIAREMQVYSTMFELVPILHKMESEEAKNELKNSVFCNSMMSVELDQRKYIRNVRSIVDSGMYRTYMQRQNKIAEDLMRKKDSNDIHNKEDISKFVNENQDIKVDLQVSLDRALLQSKKAQTKGKPAMNVSKCTSLLLDIDTRIFSKLSDEEKDNIRTQLQNLKSAISMIEQELE